VSPNKKTVNTCFFKFFEIAPDSGVVQQEEFSDLSVTEALIKKKDSFDAVCAFSQPPPPPPRTTKERRIAQIKASWEARAAYRPTQNREVHRR
jgi:hypothetical protein